ncbi:Uncharacterised protein [Mycobacteroides abscessus subsp. abscessus]|nr:Uncharacterised protein [Mycobacteroides abscessus subsp. abscessus]
MDCAQYSSNSAHDFGHIASGICKVVPMTAPSCKHRSAVSPVSGPTKASYTSTNPL